MSVATTIQLAKICQYLSVDEAGKVSFYKGGSPLNKNLAQKIYTIRKTVEWCNDNDPTNDYLTSTANYLYALCGKYILAAQNVSSAGGSAVVPSSPTSIDTTPYTAFYTATGSEGSTISIATLFPAAAGKTIFFVSRGVPLEIIDAGTPTPNQVRITSTQLIFDTNSPLFAGEVLIILYRNTI